MDGTDSNFCNDDSDIEIIEEWAANPKAVPGITEVLIKIENCKEENALLESSSLELRHKLNIIANEKVQIESDFRDFRSEVTDIMREANNSLSEKTTIIKIFEGKVEQLRNEIENVKEKLSSSKKRIKNTKNEIEKKKKVLSDKVCQTEFETVDKVEFDKLTTKYCSNKKEKEEFDRMLVAERSQIANLKQLIKNATDAQRKLNSKILKVREENDRQQTSIEEHFMEIGDFIQQKRQKFELSENILVPEKMKSDSHFQIQKEETSEDEKSIKSFMSKDTLKFKGQNKIRTSKQFRCDMCKRSFEIKGTLYTHIRTVHVEGTSLALCKCDVCGKSFVSKGRVYNHIHSVHSILSHKCKICNVEFSSKGNCTQHIRTQHTKKEIERIRMMLGRTHSVCRSYRNEETAD